MPGEPRELVAEPTDKSIVIHWRAPADSHTLLVRKYLLKYGIGFPDHEIALPGNTNSFIINNLGIRTKRNSQLNSTHRLKDVFIVFKRFHLI